jgi:small subunit ribosomal protein S4
MVKRPYPPGPKGKRRKGPPSEFAKQLAEKQKLRKIYNLSERQFKNYVKEILKKRGRALVGDASVELIKVLESRLDNTVFRLGFATSRKQARQLVSHGYFLVNGKSVNIPSYLVKKGDVISLKPGKLKKKICQNFKDLLKKYNPPSWFEFNKEKLEGKVIGEVNVEEIAPPVEISTIFEYYSK